jgi:hypothetical protein
MSTATTTETAGNSSTVKVASVLELRDDGTGNSKHLVINAKKRAKECPYRKDQEGGSEALKKRLGACVEEFDNSIFDTRSNESLVRGARKLILKSGKKKSNLVASLSLRRLGPHSPSPPPSSFWNLAARPCVLRKRPASGGVHLLESAPRV